MMDFARQQRAAVAEKASGAPFMGTDLGNGKFGYVAPQTPPITLVGYRAVSYSLPADFNLRAVNLTCAQWSALTWPQRLNRVAANLTRSTPNIFAAQDDEFAHLNEDNAREATAIAHAIDAYCLGEGIRAIQDQKSYGKAIPQKGSGDAGAISPSGGVAAGLSFSLPELIVGGVLGFIAAKMLT